MAKLQGGTLSSILLETAKEAKDEGMNLLGVEEAEGLTDKADIKQPQHQYQFVGPTGQGNSVRSPVFPLHFITKSPLPALSAA